MGGGISTRKSPTTPFFSVPTLYNSVCHRSIQWWQVRISFFRATVQYITMVIPKNISTKKVPQIVLSNKIYIIFKKGKTNTETDNWFKKVSVPQHCLVLYGDPPLFATCSQSRILNIKCCLLDILQLVICLQCCCHICTCFLRHSTGITLHLHNRGVYCTVV